MAEFLAPEPEGLPQPAERPARNLAIVVLAVCCVFWGFAFPAMKLATQAVEHAAPGNASPTALKLTTGAVFNSWRFFAAGVLYWLLTRRRQRNFKREEIIGGFITGLFIGAGMFAQIAGLQYTVPSISCFLTALTIVFTPIGQALFLHRRVNLPTWLAVGVAALGVVILAWPDSSPQTAQAQTLPPFVFMGEILTIIGAIFFSGQILSIDHYGRTADPVRLTSVMIFTTALTNACCGLSSATGQIYSSAALKSLAGDVTFQWTVPLLIIFSTVAALHLMILYQPKITPAAATVVYCLEPIFGTLFSILLQMEKLALSTLVGGAIILLAVLLVAWNEGKEQRKISK